MQEKSNESVFTLLKRTLGESKSMFVDTTFSALKAYGAIGERGGLVRDHRKRFSNLIRVLPQLDYRDFTLFDDPEQFKKFFFEPSRDCNSFETLLIRKGVIVENKLVNPIHLMTTKEEVMERFRDYDYGSPYQEQEPEILNDFYEEHFQEPFSEDEGHYDD